MARIPESTLNRLKSDIAVQRLAEAANIKLKKHGHDLIGLCPFHDDKEPSLVITPDKNLWHCLGACQTGGSVIDWVMKMEGVSFKHAVELLLSDFIPLAANESKPVKKATVKKLDQPLTDEDDDALMLQVVNYYHNILKQTPDALDYLKQRGIDNPEIIDHFKLGFANRSLGYRLPDKNRKAGAEVRGRLTQLGIYRESGHEHFNGSLVIPVINDNVVTEMYGRKTINRLRTGTPKHLYLSGAHKGLFNLDAIKHNNEIILCESLIDALTFWSAGFRNVTCSYGIEGFTKDHEKAFTTQDIERVLIAYDNDEAGNKAADTLATKLIKSGIDCYRLVFPKGMDANDYALQVKPASKSLGLVIRKAAWLGKGKAKPLTTQSVIESNETLIPLVADVELDLTEETKEQDQQQETITAEESPLPATPVPAPSTEDINAEINDDEITFNFDVRRYRIRGLKKNLSYDQLKINVLVNVEADMHVDTFDLYQARGRNSFIKQTSIELRVDDNLIKKDLAKILLKLETIQHDIINEAVTPEELTPVMTADEQNDALALLKSPDLLQQILNDYNRCGIVGEETNKLVGYLAAVSRQLSEPIAIIIQSTSAAGKSALMDAVLSFMPEEERVQYSAMTGQSLFYMGETNLKHKILAISEEEGASQAAYALKLLQSEGQLTIASTGKDADTGKHVTHEYTVEGPVMIFLTTTAIDIDEELMNRCIVLTVDEDREQTQAIHQLQRKKRTLAGLLAKAEKETILTLHHNAQRLLKPLHVVNPFAEQLTFLDDKTRTRRDHDKYLTLIEAIALLHQYQREVKTTVYKGQSLEYIEATIDDIRIANQLANDVLGRSLDELPPQTRRLLNHIDDLVKQQCKQNNITRTDYRFSRRDVRLYCSWSDAQVKKHVKRLEELEYLLVHRGQRGQSFLYELLYEGQGKEGQPFMMKLVDVKALKQNYDAKKDPLNEKKDPLSTPQVPPKDPLSIDTKNAQNDLLNNHLDAIPVFISKNTDQENKNNNNASYRRHASVAAKN